MNARNTAGTVDTGRERSGGMVRAALRAVRRRGPLLRALSAVSRPLVLTALALRLVSSMVPAAVALSMAELVRRATTASANDPFGAVAGPLAAFGLVLLVSRIASSAGQPLDYLIASRIDGAHRQEVMRLASTSSTIAALEQPRVQELVRDARADPQSWTERTPGDGAVDQLNLVGATAGVVFSAAVLAGYAWWLVPVLAVPAVLNAWVRRRQQGEFTRLWVSQSREGLRAHIWQEAIVSPGEGKDLRTFGLGEWTTERIGGHIRDMFAPVWAANLRYVGKQWIQFVLVALPLTGSYLVFTREVATGGHDIAALTAVLSASWGVYASAKSLDPRNTHGAVACLKARAELRELLDEVHDVGDGVGEDHHPVPDATPTTPDVCFENVVFRYPGGAEEAPSAVPVLDGLDLRIRPGELLALVGLNGAGKSTVIKLLSGLYRPDGGRITADGADIALLDPDAWRRGLHVVFQDFVRYPLSLADNVGLGQGRLPRRDDALRAAADDAGLTPVLERLPAGWDTPLARSRSGGTDLSGGQWQQVALTRAFYALHTGSRLLVLDEPTAHLDIRTELQMFSRLAERRRGASVVLITHRLSTACRADRIALLDGGRIVESGTHDELMASHGRYAELFALQARRFHSGGEQPAEEGAPL
ncbi:ABC transporter ATP-binding protein [Streptomyces sp. B6B3]|uniref:ABC transporter ATP-binding protein n=1 Tax=Streptomyces sp. B6B3 TaxID=3153570 RepID=UPI00325F35DB